MQEYTAPSDTINPFRITHGTHKGSLPHTTPLHIHVKDALHTYLKTSDIKTVTGLYDMLLTAVEPSLLKVTLEFCKTQHDAAQCLGLSRTTLRKKLKQYDLNSRAT